MPELEDVPDLDRGLEAELAAARRAEVALERLADVGEPRLVVAPAPRRRAGASRRGSRRRRTDPRGAPRPRSPRRSRRPGRASRRPAPNAARISSSVAGRKSALEDALELRLGQPVVAAHEREDEGAVDRTTGIALDVAAGVDPELLGERLDRRHARRRDLLGRVERFREARARAGPRARSRGRPRSRRSRSVRACSRPSRTARGSRSTPCRPSSRTPPRRGRLEAAALEHAVVGARRSCGRRRRARPRRDRTSTRPS